MSMCVCDLGDETIWRIIIWGPFKFFVMSLIGSREKLSMLTFKGILLILKLGHGC
jgi:hypothetical protein